MVSKRGNLGSFSLIARLPLWWALLLPLEFSHTGHFVPQLTENFSCVRAGTFHPSGNNLGYAVGRAGCWRSDSTKTATAAPRPGH